MKQRIILISSVALLLAYCGNGTEGTPVKETGTSTSTSAEQKKEGLDFKVG